MLISDLPYLEVVNNEEQIWGRQGIKIAVAGRAIAFAFTDEPNKTVYSKAQVHALSFVGDGLIDSFGRTFSHATAGVL